VAKAKIIMKSVGGGGKRKRIRKQRIIIAGVAAAASGVSALYNAAQHENGKMAGISQRIKRRGISGSSSVAKSALRAPRVGARK
jgi:hypothetical protein